MIVQEDEGLRDPEPRLDGQRFRPKLNEAQDFVHIKAPAKFLGICILSPITLLSVVESTLVQ